MSCDTGTSCAAVDRTLVAVRRHTERGSGRENVTCVNMYLVLTFVIRYPLSFHVVISLCIVLSRV